MKKIWLIVTFLLLGGISASVFPQQKYWIYFTDKGITPSTNLAKKARAALSERAIQRRMLRSETGKIFDDSDLHVFVPYIEGVAKIGAQIQQKSKPKSSYRKLDCYHL
jgi:hypothetical protein